MRTASTAEQVRALVCSFRHRRYRGPLLAREMQLSEVQVRGVARRCPAHPVLESPRETQTPSAGLAAERALPHSTPCAPGALTPPPSALGCVRPATAVPMGILAWAPSSGPASGLLLGSLPSGTSLPGFRVGLVWQAAPQTPGARCTR